MFPEINELVLKKFIDKPQWIDRGQVFEDFFYGEKNGLTIAEIDLIIDELEREGMLEFKGNDVRITYQGLGTKFTGGYAKRKMHQQHIQQQQEFKLEQEMKFVAESREALRFQKKFSTLTLVIAIITGAFIILTFANDLMKNVKDDTETRLKGIENAIRYNTSFDSLKTINDSLLSRLNTMQGQMESIAE